MKTVFIFCLHTLFILTVSAQTEKAISIPIHQGGSLIGDTALYYSVRLEYQKKLQLENLISNQDTFYFRFWQAGQAVDIWTSDYQTYHGTVSNHLKEHNPIKWQDSTAWPHIKDYKPRKFYYQTVQLDTAMAREAYSLASRYLRSTTLRNQQPWSVLGCMGGTKYELEFSTPTNYAFRTYYEPGNKENPPEIRRVQGFANKLNEALNLEEIYETFKASIPEGGYINDGWGRIYVSRDKEK